MPLRHRRPSRPRPGRAGPADGRAELILAGDPAANWQRWAGGLSWAALRQAKVTLACHAALNAGAVRSTSGVWVSWERGAACRCLAGDLPPSARQRGLSLRTPLEETGYVLGAAGGVLPAELSS